MIQILIYFSMKRVNLKSCFKDFNDTVLLCKWSIEMKVSLALWFYTRIWSRLGVSGVLEHGGSMSPPSSKRHSASAHFADKKGIQLSPSIYLARSVLHFPFLLYYLYLVLFLSFPKFWRRSFPSSLLQRRKRFLAIQCLPDHYRDKKIISRGAKIIIVVFGAVHHQNSKN